MTCARSFFGQACLPVCAVRSRCMTVPQCGDSGRRSKQCRQTYHGIRDANQVMTLSRSAPLPQLSWREVLCNKIVDARGRRRTSSTLRQDSEDDPFEREINGAGKPLLDAVRTLPGPPPFLRRVRLIFGSSPRRFVQARQILLH